MKRPLSLLEVIIGLVLTTILITALFSNFRHLMQANSQLEKIHQEKHWTYVTRVRLNQIFENIHAGAVFKTEPYRDISDQALHFTFNNGIDSDPKFCQELEGYLLLNKEKEFCLIIEAKGGRDRKEIFLRNVENCSIEFFNPTKQKWLSKWQQNTLPPLVKISIGENVFHFVMPHANRMAVYP